MSETGYTLRELVERVQEARVRAAEARDHWGDLLSAFEAQHEPEIAAWKGSHQDLADRESELRTAAVNWYILTGQTNKAPAPGVVIKLMTRLEYPELMANAWGLEHKMFTRLDARAFEAFAKKSPDEVPFVHVRQEPQATIASDLQEILRATEAKS